MKWALQLLEKNCSCQNSTLKVNDLYSVCSSTLYTYSARLSSFVWGEISWTPWWVAVSSSEKAALCFVLYWMFWKRKKTFIMAAHRTQLSGEPFGSSKKIEKNYLIHCYCIFHLMWVCIITNQKIKLSTVLDRKKSISI